MTKLSSKQPSSNENTIANTIWNFDYKIAGPLFLFTGYKLYKMYNTFNNISNIKYAINSRQAQEGELKQAFDFSNEIANELWQFAQECTGTDKMKKESLQARLSELMKQQGVLEKLTLSATLTAEPLDAKKIVDEILGFGRDKPVIHQYTDNTLSALKHSLHAPLTEFASHKLEALLGGVALATEGLLSKFSFKDSEVYANIVGSDNTTEQGLL